MFKLLKQVLRTGDATAKYPDAPYPVSDNYRGKPEYAARQCIACAACTVACPANALTMQTDLATKVRTWAINYGRCVFCGRCEEVCPTGAIVLSRNFELAVRSKADLTVTAEFGLVECRECGTPFAPRKELEYVMALLARAEFDAADIEGQRAHFETCPECKRRMQAAQANETFFFHSRAGGEAQR